MTAVLFATAILVPEHSFQVIAVFAVLVVHDLNHRQPGVAWWRTMRLTRAFVITGAALTVAWCAFLAVMGALKRLDRLLPLLGPGHAASGALPLDLVDVGGWATVFVVTESP